MDRIIDIHKACDAEINILLGIWIRRSKKLAAKHMKMWNPDQFTTEELRKVYITPDYYIGYVNGEPFGGFILIEKDERYWPGNSGKACYFHKFVVDESFAGQGLSKEILDWVKEYGRQNGKDFIRLDFEEDREYLKKLYYGNGFIKRGMVKADSGKEITLAECVL